MKKIRKAIIPAAGLGTRVLPASKAIPKEMLNIVDKPAIQYIVEEAFNSGIEEVLIITNRGKGAIEDHFDHAFELESKLEGNPDKADLLDSVKACASLGNIYFLRQKESKPWTENEVKIMNYTAKMFALLLEDYAKKNPVQSVFNGGAL